MKNAVYSFSALALAISSVHGGMAYAAEKKSGGLSSLIEEVVVTARKREEGLQDTPIAVSAFTGESLEARGIDQLDDVTSITPNVTFVNASGNGGSANNAQVYIRGVGQQDHVPTSDPGVGIYVDDVYIARSVGAVLDLVDIERLEVLRGPQGTLFGRNTIGGAISIHTVKPHETFEAKVKAKVGSDSRRDLSAKFNLPISDTVFSSITLASQRQDGFIKNASTGSELGEDDALSARGALRWLASDDLEVNVSADYSRSRTSGQAVVSDGRFLIDPTGLGNDLFLHNFVLGAANIGANNCDANPGNNFEGTNQSCANSSTIQAGVNSGLGPSFDNSEVMGGSVTLDWSINDNLDFKSITAYRKLSSHFSYDADASFLVLQDQVEDFFEQDQWSQEFQLLGTALDDSLSWILGSYYFVEEGSNINPISFVAVRGLSGGFFRNESVAAFGQATYDITDQLHLTVGLRYTRDSKRFTVDTGAVPGLQFIHVNLAPVFSFQAVDPGSYHTDASDTTPMVNLAYDWSDNLMVYATYSEGFKSGGFQQRVVGALGAAPEYDPETVESYELGFKYSNDDSTLTLNGAVFYADYSDIQLEVFRGIAPILENAGEGEMQGVELELRWAPAESWFIESALGYLDTEITDADPGVALSGGSSDGDRFADVPEKTASLSVIKEFDLGDSGVLRPRVDLSYRSHVFFSPNNDPFEAQDGYSVFNASVSWTSPSEKYVVTLLGSNLGDKAFVYSNNLQDALGVGLETPARGREWYLTAEVKFD